MRKPSLPLRLLLLVIACLCPLAAHAQVLTLDSCVHMALSNNRDIRAAQLRTAEQLQTQRAFRANFFPNFSGSGLYLNAFRNDYSFDTNVGNLLPEGIRNSIAGYKAALVQAIGQFDPELAQRLAAINGDISIDYKLQNIYAFALSMQQPIYMGGKITAAYRMNKLGTQMAQLNETLTRDQVIVQTHEAYALLLKATEMHRVALQYDSLLAQLISDVESAERHGLRGHNEVLKVQVKKNEAELQVLQAHNGILLAQMNLCHYIGMPLGNEVQIAEVQATQVQPASASATVLTRPEYNLLELKSELARQKVRLVRSDFLPQLGVQLSATYAHGGELMGSTLLNSTKPGAFGMVSLTVPIWHANEAQHRVKAAKLEYERTQLEQQDLVEKMNLELQQAANQLDEAILELQLAHRSVEQATENLRNSRRAFDVGLEPLSDLLTAQTLWQQAHAKRVIAESQLLVCQAKYRKASGQL